MHSYNKVSERLALESIMILLPKLAKIRKELESWMNTKSYANYPRSKMF
ncbi:MAG: hypothetical protein JTT16_00425 [Candidatus Brockarchaeota archaeon]|nr:hypothetical protein [Candidatus Brockarchaeota archaeon]MBO3802069.1 hypothetical protein [Candidatus Brockarchaeota archaeon]